MNTPLTDDDIRKLAQRRVGLKMGFYIHATVFVCVNLGLFALNLYQGGQRWHGFPLMGWGLGLAIHGVVTLLNLNGNGLRERLLAAEIEKLKGRR